MIRSSFFRSQATLKSERATAARRRALSFFYTLTAQQQIPSRLCMRQHNTACRGVFGVSGDLGILTGFSGGNSRNQDNASQTEGHPEGFELPFDRRPQSIVSQHLRTPLPVLPPPGVFRTSAPFYREQLHFAKPFRGRHRRARHSCNKQQQSFGDSHGSRIQTGKR